MIRQLHGHKQERRGRGVHSALATYWNCEVWQTRTKWNQPTNSPAPPPPHPVSLYVCEKTLPQYAYSPYCSAYISLSVDKENFWQTRTSLVGNHFLFYSCDLTKWVRGVTIRENSRPTITPCKGQKVNRAACIESPDNWVCSILDCGILFLTLLKTFLFLLHWPA